MKAYLFDASAAVEIYIPSNPLIRQKLQDILGQRERGEAVLFIPNFCVAEVFNTFAKKHFEMRGFGDTEYNDKLNEFREHIHWGKTLYAYDLNRYHIIAADKIILTEHKVIRKYGEKALSTFDILIIAMSCELAYTREVEKTFLLTCDQRLSKVCNNIRKDPLNPDPGELKAPYDSRWIPPECIFLDNSPFQGK